MSGLRETRYLKTRRLGPLRERRDFCGRVNSTVGVPRVVSTRVLTLLSRPPRTHRARNGTRVRWAGAAPAVTCGWKSYCTTNSPANYYVTQTSVKNVVRGPRRYSSFGTRVSVR